MIKNKTLILFFLVFSPFAAIGKHIFGGELLYTYVSGNTYKVALTLYADCAEAATNNLYTSQPQVVITANGATYNTISLSPESGTGTEVTPVCPADANNTSCHGGSLPGVKKFAYSGTVVLNSNNTSWTFTFSGKMSAGGPQMGIARSNNITNVINVGSQNVYLVATLNTSEGPNSSPQFSTLPTPFYCINVAQQYNQGAIDPNSDSLYFELTPALTNGNLVSYYSSFSATHPLTTTSFSFNNLNGQMNFTPSAVQNGLVVNKVYEYKNGVLVGTSIREMTFIIQSNCTNNPPTALLNTISGGVASDSNSSVINVCQGTTSVSFRIDAHDPDQQNVTATYTSLPAGSTILITGNGGTNPVLNFSWNTANITAGTYTFFVTFTDNGCPLVSKQTIAYTVNIVQPNAVNAVILSRPSCDKKAWVQLNFYNGISPRNISILQGSTIVKSYNNVTNIITDSFAVGIYTIQMSSPGFGCVSNAELTIIDSLHPVPIHADSIFYCKNAVAIPLSATITTGTGINWYDANGNALAIAPTPSTTTAGVSLYVVSQHFEDCDSKKDTIYVLVTDRPHADFVLPAEICSNDTITVSFTGSAGANAIYTWNFNNPTYANGNAAGPYAVNWATGNLKTVTLNITENHCAGDTATKQINVKTAPDARFSLDAYACINNAAKVSYEGTDYAGTTYTWDFAEATGGVNSLPGNYYLQWADTGSKTVTLTAVNNGCITTVVHEIMIYALPNVVIQNREEKLCMGDKIYLVANGASSYIWSPAEKIKYEIETNAPYTYVMQPTLFIVTGTNEYGCLSKDSLRYTDIEPCCNFSYPNAFTPNNDGRNDRFNIITYGNTISYKLFIFDRWGQCLFNSYNQSEGWDGSFKGRECETGTYFYLFESKCVTGHIETSKGDVLLIR